MQILLSSRAQLFCDSLGRLEPPGAAKECAKQRAMSGKAHTTDGSGRLRIKLKVVHGSLGIVLDKKQQVALIVGAAKDSDIQIWDEVINVEGIPIGNLSLSDFFLQNDVLSRDHMLVDVVRPKNPPPIPVKAQKALAASREFQDLVTVPFSELLDRSKSGQAQAGSMMEKKAGFLGQRPWQRGWFELTKDELSYYEVTPPVAVLCGQIRLEDVVSVHADAGTAELSVVHSNSRIFRMRAAEDESATLDEGAPVSSGIIGRLQKMTIGSSTSSQGSLLSPRNEKDTSESSEQFDSGKLTMSGKVKDAPRMPRDRFIKLLCAAVEAKQGLETGRMSSAERLSAAPPEAVVDHDVGVEAEVLERITRFTETLSTALASQEEEDETKGQRETACL